MTEDQTISYQPLPADPAPPVAPIGVSGAAWTIDVNDDRFVVTAHYRYPDGRETEWTQGVALLQLAAYKAFLGSFLALGRAADEDDVAGFLAAASYPATHDTPLHPDAVTPALPARLAGTAPDRAF